MDARCNCDLQVVNVTKILHFEGKGKQAEAPGKPPAGSSSEGEQTWSNVQISFERQCVVRTFLRVL